MSDQGKLSIIATPIGNMDDITIRAIRTLFSVDAIVCEDTRKTSQLLRELQKRHPELATPSNGEKFQRMMSYYEENEASRIPEVITALKSGLRIALVSDAGTPTVSDPGFKLVRECVKEGIPIDSLPGPSSVILALTLSGLPTDKFIFLGYPPRKPGHRKTFFANARESQKSMSSTMIYFEAPHRMKQVLEELLEAFGDVQIVVCRELTKLHQEIRRELISEAIEHFRKVAPRGEFILVINTHLEE